MRSTFIFPGGARKKERKTFSSPFTFCVSRHLESYIAVCFYIFTGDEKLDLLLILMGVLLGSGWHTRLPFRRAQYYVCGFLESGVHSTPAHG